MMESKKNPAFASEVIQQQEKKLQVEILKEKIIRERNEYSKDKETLLKLKEEIINAQKTLTDINHRIELYSRSKVISSASVNISDQQNICSTTDDSLRKELSNAITIRNHMKNDLIHGKALYSELSTAYLEANTDFSNLFIKQKQLEEEILTTNKLMQHQTIQIARLNEKLLSQSEKEAFLSNKLMQYKNQLIEAESYYQKYQLVQINPIECDFCTIELKHNHYGEFVIEIANGTNRVLYGIHSIESISLHDHSERLFFIRIAHGRTFEFEDKNAKAIVAKMNFFIQASNTTNP